jgi:hypothetical protein
VAVVRIQAIVNRDPTYQPVTGWLMFTLACLGVVCEVTILVVIGMDKSGMSHGHNGGHEHDHAAPMEVDLPNSQLRGRLEIVETSSGERMHFT